MPGHPDLGAPKSSAGPLCDREKFEAYANRTLLLDFKAVESNRG